MKGFNRVQLIGNLGSDPELRTTTSGVEVATVTIASNESWKDAKGEKHEEVQWTRLVFWRGLAEVVDKYLKKGDAIFVEGSLKTRTYEKDGDTRYSTEVVVKNLVMLGGQGEGPRREEGPPSSAYDEEEFALAGEEDLPY